MVAFGSGAATDGLMIVTFAVCGPRDSPITGETPRYRRTIFFVLIIHIEPDEKWTGVVFIKSPVVLYIKRHNQASVKRDNQPHFYPHPAMRSLIEGI
jgi:hypothetical protein